VTDTSPKAEQVQIELLRRASVARRGQLTFSLSADMIALARRAVHRLHPEWSETQVKLEFVRTHYGPELAARVAARIGAQCPDSSPPASDPEDHR
jgi:hypothetical protein